MSRNTIASIDLAAIRHNLGVVRKLVPGSKIASVVKADGYGHGITRVVGALQDSDLLAVATSGEAAALRNGGWTGRLLMLEGYANVNEYELARFLNWYYAYHLYFFHLVCVWFVIFYLPYSKLGHMLYRTIAIGFAKAIDRTR